MEITRRIEFDAAHTLSESLGGRESNVHGHRYVLEVSVKGPINEEGIVMNLSDIKRILKEEVLEELDHKMLNDVIENPTAENIVVWIWKKLEGKLDLSKLRLWETPNNSVTYEGEDINH